jgi:hypothetical protein
VPHAAQSVIVDIQQAPAGRLRSIRSPRALPHGSHQPYDDEVAMIIPEIRGQTRIPPSPLRSW